MITSLSDEVGRVHRRGHIRDFEVAYHKLNEFVDKINDKILNRLQLVQQVYLEDYKQQVNIMSQQLKELRANFDSQVLYQRSNEKMYLLEEERDFFRGQVLKLNQEVNGYLDQNKALKKKIAELEVQVSNFKTIAFNYEKKIQKLQLERTQMASFKIQSSCTTIPLVVPREEPEQPKILQLQTLEPKIVASHSRATLFERKSPQTVRTRTLSKIESATKASMRRFEEVNQKEQIIDECIKEIKKDIFYRNSEQKGQISPFEDITKVSFDKFTRTDKKSIIYKLLSNEKLVDEFGEFLSSRTSSEGLSRMVRTKVADEKFNDKFLSDLKRSFSKKMFQLKAKPRRDRELDTQ